MIDRGLPIVDGAPACPFVAFDDDREERASGPDTRHRCYAEVRPAPRALAHQDAYCLSSAFALCPTFQDWARRESARPRDASPAERLPAERLSAEALPAERLPAERLPAERLPAERLPAERLSAEALIGEVLPAEAPPRRNPQRSWTAPPPWVGSPGEDPTLPSGQAEHRPGAPDFLAPRRRTEAGLAGSLAYQIAMDALPQPALPSDAGRYAPPGSPARGAYSGLASRTDQGDDDGQDDEAFDRERERERAMIPGRAPARPGGLARVGARVGAMLTGRGRPTVGNTRPRRRSGEPATPSWERPHRYEAYPTLRTRIGIPALPRLAFLAVALVLSMLGLFMLPGLLGLGSPQGSPSPVPSQSRSAAPSGSPGPSIVPVPTAQTYVVEPGDTFSKIAAKFGVALADLVAANRDKFPNPDRIVVGDTVMIPAPLPSGFTIASPAATAAPGPKASPTRAPTRTPTKAPTRAPTKAP